MRFIRTGRILAIVVVASSLIALSVVQLSLVVSHAGNIGLAQSILDNAAALDMDGSGQASSFETTSANTACRTQLMTSGVVIALFLADQHISEERKGQLENVSRLDASLELAERSIDALLSCSPADGDAWLRLGLLDAYASGYSENAVTLIERSQIYAPHERRVIRDRLARLPANPGVLRDGTRLSNIRAKDEAALDWTN